MTQKSYQGDSFKFQLSRLVLYKLAMDSHPQSSKLKDIDAPCRAPRYGPICK